MGFLLFFVGGLCYMCLELIWRGRTHYSMGLAGGLATALLVALYAANDLPLWAGFLWGMLVITSVEFLFGVIFNLRLRQNVWDYSHLRFQLYGQICLSFSLLWGVAGTGLWALTGAALGRALSLV